MIKAILYTRDYCVYCVKAKRKLEELNIPIEEIDVEAEEGRMEEMIRLSGRMTLPQIFFHVGGCDDLYELDEKGGLDVLKG